MEMGSESTFLLAYVDDALILATSIEQMKMVLAAMIEAIFIVMGEPNDSVR